MKPVLKLFFYVCLMTTFSCQEKFEYKFQDMPNFTVCANETEPLLKEAFYSFEHDIKVHIGNLNAQSEQIYGQWFYPTLKNKLDVKEFVSPHTVKVFEMLKESKPEIWDVYNEDSNLNYKSDFIKCIATNMIDKDLKTTFKALLTTNSMKPDLFSDAIGRNSLKIARDPYLKLYVVFEYGYGHMFFNDFTETKDHE